jgi:dihydroflavonol-4-reductase
MMATERSIPRVLVTGAGGFIGAHLAVRLSREHQRVVALDIDLRRLREVRDINLELIEGDFTDPGIQRRALEGVGTVYHLAAAHLEVATGAAEFWRVNVAGLENFARAAIEAGISRFVHCSSVGVYGRVKSPPADEETPPRPELEYEKTKLAGEGVILDAVRDAGLPAIILRPAWVYGPGCPRTERLFRAIRKGYFVVAGRGTTLRHCVYIRDMLEALILAAAAKDVVGKVVIIGDAAAVPLRMLVDEMARISGGRRPRAVPFPILHLAALAAEAMSRSLGRDPPLSRRTLRFFTGNTSFAISRARRLLGYTPEYDLSSGLSETYSVLEGGASWTLPPRTGLASSGVVAVRDAGAAQQGGGVRR